MSTTSTARPHGLDPAVQRRSLLKGSAAGAATATLVNAALWAWDVPRAYLSRSRARW